MTLFDEEKPEKPKRHRVYVGYSENRTPIKHDIYRAHLGRDVAAAPYVVAKARRYNWGGWTDLNYNGHLIVDLTAGNGDGDGVHEKWYFGCSPGISAYIASLHQNIRVRLVEKNKQTFQRLIQNLTEHLPKLGYQQTSETFWAHGKTKSSVNAIFGDARKVDVFSGLHKHEWIYVYNDPNNMHGWILNVPLFASLIDGGTRFGSFMSTMGCNPHGIKRLPWNLRKIWFDHILETENIIISHPRLDLILIETLNDSAQWAYLLLTPKGWIDDSVKAITTKFTKAGRRIATSSLQSDSNVFHETTRRLFLTKSEMDE